MLAKDKIFKTKKKEKNKGSGSHNVSTNIIKKLFADLQVISANGNSSCMDN